MNISWRNFAFSLLALWALVATTTAAEPRKVSVLIVGNSYVYHNDLPHVLSSVAKAAGQIVEVESVTAGGLTLKDHVQQGRAAEKIRSRKWDYVVLQGQSQEALKDPSGMRGAAKVLQAEIARSGARTLLFVTWAKKAAPDSQPVITKTYDALARELGAEIIPVGPAWMAAQGDRSSPRLYDGDGSHPSRLGTYLAACAFYGSIFDQSPVGLPAKVFGVSDEEIRVVQATSWAAVKIVKEGALAEQKLAEEARKKALALPGTNKQASTPSPGTRRKPLVVDLVPPPANTEKPAPAPVLEPAPGQPAPATPLPEFPK